MKTVSAEIELARRLEEAEAFVAEAYALEVARRRPGADVAVEEVAGGRAVFAGPGSPLTETKAIGLHGGVAEADLDRMESVFFSRAPAAPRSATPSAVIYESRTLAHSSSESRPDCLVTAENVAEAVRALD